ncbi:Rieske (2Fe-2S) protein [Pontibacter lucknowensis]|uniref:Rieske domain-containing protein n=1 Tax=Pontibacter lucknowensis TaxID=1077936 RepID=A0A1N6U980_9BACT|nr:hypothetical protein [Pontibacter lucknowensis]SIQ62061.1 hypothetical protein SAMN05421545_0755 [Pontibacter lucknowensis]
MAASLAKASTTISKLLCLLALLLLTSCGSDNPGPGIPNVPVSEQINVNSQLYTRLRQDGGYVYLNSGYKGIIVIRQHANLYLAFERACPYDPTATAPCGQVEADQSNLFIVDTCCGSQFNFQGGVNAGPAVYGLRQYRTVLNGSLLSIFN